MSTSRYAASVIETRYVWGPTIQSAMDQAQHMTQFGWIIEGNPAPMVFNGKHGTGVAISRVTNG